MIWTFSRYAFGDEPDDMVERFIKVADELTGAMTLTGYQSTDVNYAYSDGWDVQGRLLEDGGVLVLYRRFGQSEDAPASDPFTMVRPWRYAVGKQET